MYKTCTYELVTFVHDWTRGEFRGHFPTEEAARARAEAILAGYDPEVREKRYRITLVHSNELA